MALFLGKKFMVIFRNTLNHFYTVRFDAFNAVVTSAGVIPRHPNITATLLIAVCSTTCERHRLLFADVLLTSERHCNMSSIDVIFTSVALSIDDVLYMAIINNLHHSLTLTATSAAAAAVTALLHTL